MRQIQAATGICFFRNPFAVTLSDFLRVVNFAPLAIESSEQSIREWFDFGCVYVDGQRRRGDGHLTPGQTVRIHTRRKRFAVPSLLPHIVFNHAEFLAIDKPAGVPTHPTLDNYLENAKVRLEQELGQTLYTTHRLDVPTEGLLILAKTSDAQKLINKLFSLGRVSKTYRALNSQGVRPDLYEHYMDPESRVPKIISNVSHPDWWTCRLQIERSEKLMEFYWHEMTLLTGKTHQIRAQMAYMGAPVLGDVTYGAERLFVGERIALECYQLGFTFRGESILLTRPQSLTSEYL